MERHCMSSSVPSIEVKYLLPSRIEEISPVVDDLILRIAARRPADGSEIDIEIALREALTNAVVHGNHGDPDRHVDIRCRCGADGAVDITIRDQGEGFDCRALPDPTAGQNRMSGHGRGVYLMRALMDEVRYEDLGRVVYMRKHPARNTPERFANNRHSEPTTRASQATGS